MRPQLSALFLLSLLAMGAAIAGSPANRPSLSTERDEARWADWEAQARITDGDYDGAVQAQQRADAQRRAVEEREAAAANTDREKR